MFVEKRAFVKKKVPYYGRNSNIALASVYTVFFNEDDINSCIALEHITKIPPGTKFKDGDQVSVYVEGVDKGARRISLGLILTQKPVGYK